MLNIKYNYEFGKLINNNVIYAPYAGMYQGKWYSPLTDEMHIARGYKPVVKTSYPTDGNTYIEKWVESSESITQTWECTHIQDNEEKRREAYDTRKVVEYNNATYTINESNQIYLELMAEGSTVAASALVLKIKTQKNKIKDEFPV